MCLCSKGFSSSRPQLVLPLICFVQIWQMISSEMWSNLGNAFLPPLREEAKDPTTCFPWGNTTTTRSTSLPKSHLEVVPAIDNQAADSRFDVSRLNVTSALGIDDVVVSARTSLQVFMWLEWWLSTVLCLPQFRLWCIITWLQEAEPLKDDLGQHYSEEEGCSSHVPFQGCIYIEDMAEFHSASAFGSHRTFFFFIAW